MKPATCNNSMCHPTVCAVIERRKPMLFFSGEKNIALFKPGTRPFAELDTMALSWKMTGAEAPDCGGRE